jgi:hypothetical protein
MNPAFDILIDNGGRLVYVDETGNRHENVRPARMFPLTDPEGWISLQGPSGEEVGFIENAKTLTREQQAALSDAFAKRDFVPVVRSIDRISRAADGHLWQVTTDRGPTIFRIETDESIQQLGANRMVIVDDHNTRYLIPDIDKLDVESRRRLERYY